MPFAWTKNALGRLTLLLALAAPAGAQGPVFSTGVGAGGAALGSAVADPHWTFVKGPPTSTSGSAVTIGPGGFFGGCCGFGPYVPNTATARWVSTSPTGDAATGNGDVTYTQTFDLTGYVLSTVSITGNFAIADNFMGAFLNGVRLASAGANIPSSSAPWSTLHPFAVAAGDPLFVSGVNRLVFIAGVENPDFNGLFVDLTSTGQLAVTAAPEPATVALLGTGLLAVVALRRRRR